MSKPETVNSGFSTTPDPATFQKLLAVAPDAIVIVNQNGRITYANAQAEQLFGYDASELLGKTVEVLLPSRLRAAHVAQRTQYLKAPVSRPMGPGIELVGLHKDGTEIPVEISLSAATTDQGAWVMSTIRDIRERRRAEAERARLKTEVVRERQDAQAEARQAQRGSSALRALVDTIPAGVVMSDAKGAIILSNTAANDIFGGIVTGTAYGPTSRYTLHSLDGSPFPPSDLPLPRAIERGEATHDVTIVVRHENGVERVILAAGTPERDPDGQITGAVAVFQDITERERTQQALREREERLRLITGSSPDAMFYQDPNLRYQWVVNPVPPFTEETVLGRTDVDLLPLDQAIPLVELKKRVMASGVGARTVVHRVRQGVDRSFEVVLEPRRDPSGNVVGVFGYARDITERKRADEELARLTRTIAIERSRLQTILDSAINPIIFVDAETGYLRANPEAEKLFGHAIVPEAGRAQYVGQIHDPEGHLVPLPDLLATRALRGETPARQECLIVRPDGSKVPVVENAAPIRIRDGKIAGAVIVFQDISVLKELERVREEWTSVIAHDLRQPVTVISGYAGLVAREITPTLPRARAHVDHILTSARQLNRMIVDLLDVSRIEARRLKLERRPVDLPTLVREVVERAAEFTKGHAVSVSIRGSIPILDGDPERIEQVLVNLLSNAAKYGDPGCPIEVEVESRQSDVQVAVSNQGPGIPPDELRALFTRFYRTTSAQGGRTPGIGLGLYISKWLVEAHGGRIWAESSPGEKTTFRFTLPITTAQ